MDISRKEILRLEPYKIIMWVIIVVLLYLINSTNRLLFHTLVELFSITIAIRIFLTAWESKLFLKMDFRKFLVLILNLQLPIIRTELFSGKSSSQATVLKDSADNSRVQNNFCKRPKINPA